MAEFEWMQILMKHWLITLALLFLVAAFIVLMLVARRYGEGKGLAKYSPVAEIMAALILLFTLISVYRQIVHVQEQNDLQRAVASKSAIQELNKVLLDKQQKDFLRFLFFPKLIDASNDKSDLTPEEEQAREAMMAFSLMNSLEMLYLTRDKNADDEAFKGLLHGFIRNVRVHWNDDFATVYHHDFQKIVKEVFDEMEKAEEEVAKVLAMFEEQDLRTRCFPNPEEAQAGWRRALGSGDYDQALTINLEDYRLPKVFVVRVVGKDEKVAVRFQDGTTLPLDVLRRSGERGEAIPSN